MSTTLDKLRAALEKDRPTFVARILTKLGTDSTGDDAVWVWLILHDELVPTTDDNRVFEEASWWARTRVKEVLPDHFVYTAFRTSLEQDELDRTEEETA